MITGVFRNGADEGLDVLAKAVAYVADGIDESVIGILNLAAETAHVYVDGAVSSVVVIPPHFVQQDLTRVDSSGVTCQELQQSVFLEGQLDEASSKAHLTRCSVDGEITSSQHFATLRMQPNESPYSRLQFRAFRTDKREVIQRGMRRGIGEKIRSDNSQQGTASHGFHSPRERGELIGLGYHQDHHGG